MALIYKPNALYMSPNNESVEGDNVKASFIFKGYHLANAVGHVYVNTDGEWVDSNNDFSFTPASGYNNQRFTSSNYLVLPNKIGGKMYGWGVTIYGDTFNCNPFADNVLKSTNKKGLTTGDVVETYTRSGTTLTPYEFTFISNYSSKLSLGAVNSGTDAEGTDLTNTFTVSENVYLNLSSGDSIKEDKNATAYYIYKVNEGRSNPLAYYIKIYNTQANALAGGTTGVITGSVVENKNYYVNPIISTTNIFYVGVLNGNDFRLYTTKEAALQAVNEAIVEVPTNVYYAVIPFENSQIVPFTYVPVIVPYISPEIKTVVLTEGENNVYTYTSDYELYTGQQLLGGTLNTLFGYQWFSNPTYYYVRIWDKDAHTLSLFTNREAAIYNNSTYLTLLQESSVTVILNEVLSINKNFEVRWFDPTGNASFNTPMIVSWEADLYNVEVNNRNQVTNRILIEQSGTQYTGKVEYQFNHLLLSCLSNINGEYTDSLGRYLVVFNMTDNIGHQYKCEYLFDVGYYTTETNYSPHVIVDNCDSSITVDWNNAKAITGESSDSVGYIPNYLYSGNYGGAIKKDSTLTYNVDIPENNIPSFFFQPSDDFSGRIFFLDGETQSAELIYTPVGNGGVFNFAITNKSLDSTVNAPVNTNVEGLDPNKIYLIGYADGEVYIKEYGNSIGALTDVETENSTININDSVYNAPLTISLKGNTEQAGSSGKNLIGEFEYYNTSNYCKMVNLSAGDYTLSFVGGEVPSGLYARQGDTISSTAIKTVYDSKVMSFTVTTAGDYLLQWYKANFTDPPTQAQLERGSTATAYEPHISPDTPQDIHNVSGDNTISVTGKNLLKPALTWEQDLAGITVTPIGNGRYALSGASTDIYSAVTTSRSTLPAGTYFLSGCPSGGSSSRYRLRAYNETDNTGLTWDTGSGHTFTLSHTCSVRTTIYCYSGVNVNGLIVEPMIRLNSITDGTFEPYSMQDYSIYLPVENLFNKENVERIQRAIPNVTQWQYYNGAYSIRVPIKPSTKYTVSANNSNETIFRVAITDSENVPTTTSTVVAIYSVTLGTNTNTPITATSGANAKYLVVQMSSAQAETTMQTLQIEEGAKANHYTPYGTPVIELNKIGTYADYFYKDGSKWYVHKEIGKQVVNYAPNGSGTSTTGAYRYAVTSQFKPYTEANVGLSSHFLYNVNYNAPSGCFYNSTSTIIFFCDIAQADITRWVQANQPTFYGVLSTPIETEITDSVLISQLDAISKAVSYAETTSILQTNNDASFILTVDTVSYN